MNAFVGGVDRRLFDWLMTRHSLAQRARCSFALIETKNGAAQDFARNLIRGSADGYKHGDRVPQCPTESFVRRFAK